MTKKLELTMACGLYDRMLDLYTGDVRPDGITLNFIPMDGSAGARESSTGWLAISNSIRRMSSSEFFARDRRARTSWSPAGVSVAGVPPWDVYLQRALGHQVAEGSRRQAGRVPIYTMSAAVWMKGHLQDDYGVDPSKIIWVEGAINHPGQHGHPSILPLLRPARSRRTRPTSRSRPSGERRRRRDHRHRAAGCVSHQSRRPAVVSELSRRREGLLQAHRIFPIMHLLAMRRDVYEAHPFIASSLFDAMCEFEERARQRMRDLGTLNYMLPWMTGDIDELDEVFDGDPWPYGIEPNRPTLEALMTYLTDQGIIKAPMPIEGSVRPRPWPLRPQDRPAIDASMGARYWHWDVVRESLERPVISCRRVRGAHRQDPRPMKAGPRCADPDARREHLLRLRFSGLALRELAVGAARAGHSGAGAPRMMTRALEREIAKLQWTAAPQLYMDHENPYEVLVKILRESGNTASRSASRSASSRSANLGKSSIICRTPSSPTPRVWSRLCGDPVIGGIRPACAAPRASPTSASRPASTNCAPASIRTR